MADRQQVRENVHSVTEYSAQCVRSDDGDLKVTLTGVAAPFRLITKFVVEAAADFLQQPDLTPEGRVLLLTALVTPGALNRLAARQ